MQHKHRYNEKGVPYSKTRLYKVWESMKSRCNTPSHTSYYGARGIKVCKEWADDFDEFRSWALAEGYDEEAPRGKCTIDRRDPDGPYSPENCYISTIQHQQRHKRNTIYIEDGGEKVCLAEYCRRIGESPKMWKYHNIEAVRERELERIRNRRKKTEEEQT